MDEIIKYVVDRIKKLLPNTRKIDFRASISDNTYSIEFFITNTDAKHQCFDLVDERVISSTDLKQCQKDIVDFVRQSDIYVHGKINKFRFSI